MSEINEIQQKFKNYRNQLAEVNLVLQKAKAELENLKTNEKLDIKTNDVLTNEEKKVFY